MASNKHPRHLSFLQPFHLLLVPPSGHTHPEVRGLENP